MRAATLALLATLALSACADATRIFNVTPIPLHRADMERAATGGTQFVEVVGAPADGAAPETIAAAMRAPAGFRQTRYVVVPPGGRELRVVLEFGANAGQPRSCESPSGARLAAGAPMRVAASLCMGRDFVSTATLSAPGVAGPSSPGFDAAMTGLLRELLTPERPPFMFGRSAGFRLGGLAPDRSAA